ncbi:MAG: hypothetical protein JWN94_36 [Betaproteobacteria bacterium]|nr:hypothetical protein [Betaproteobacteria bacterium]
MENIYTFLEPARAYLGEVIAYLPRLALALLMVVVGWFVAKAVRFAVERGLRAINFNVLTSRSGMDEFLQQGGTRSDITSVFGFLTFCLVVLASLIVAFNTLGLAYATDLLGRLMLFVPKLMFALLILTLGAYFARFVDQAVLSHCRESGVRDAEFLAKLAQYAVMTFVVLIALDLTNIGGDLVRETFLIILTGIVLAIALAFGLGGREWAASMLEHWWPRAKKDGEL